MELFELQPRITTVGLAVLTSDRKHIYLQKTGPVLGLVGAHRDDAPNDCVACAERLFEKTGVLITDWDPLGTINVSEEQYLIYTTVVDDLPNFVKFPIDTCPSQLGSKVLFDGEYCSVRVGVIEIVKMVTINQEKIFGVKK